MNFKYMDPDKDLILLLKENNLKKDEEIAEAIICSSLYAEDRVWVKNMVINKLNENKNEIIIRACLKSLGHLARLDQNINLEDVPRYILGNQKYTFLIDDLKDDIKIFSK